MWSIILEGLVFGLGLAVSLGPVFIALTETSIEKGILPGLTVGAGIWISDLIIIALLYNFIYQVKHQIENEAFNFWMGLSGAIVLIAFGLSLIFKKPVLAYSTGRHSYKSYIGFWLKGFLINTINPFTFVFWTGVMSTYIIGRGITSYQATVFLATIMIVIILSDSGKVLLANFLRKSLTSTHINQVSNFSGAILMGIGLFLAYKVL